MVHLGTRCCLLWILMLAPPAIVGAQGLLVDLQENEAYRLPRPRIWPIPPGQQPPRVPEPVYKIKELGVNVVLQDQIAKVQVSQSFENTSSRPLEVCFIFPLPYEGAVDRMTFMVDGKEYDAKLLNATEARRIYEGYVRRNQDPALVEWIGTGMFKTSVFPVPPGATRTVTLKFSQLCRKHGGLTELMFPLSTAKYTSQAVSKIGIEVSVQSQAKIKNIYSPTHPIQVQRPGDNSAKVVFASTNEIPTSDFRLLYDVGDGLVGANALSYRPDEKEDGFFMLLVSPEIKGAMEQPLPKTVVFVVDRSGSMSGKKIEQAKGALRFVLDNLREGDLFNIVAYDSAVESFRPELQRFTDETRAAAHGFVEGLYAGGSTNIDGALHSALAQLHDDSRPNYIVFVTDGLPTAGERNEVKIAENARQHNKVRARIFSFGVGYDVNSRLLDKISRVCFGQSQFVRPNEDIEAHVSQLYGRISAPAMTNVTIQFDMEDFPPEKGTVVNRVYPRDTHDLFAGDQLVLVGRYKQGGNAKVTVRGTIDGQNHAFHFPVSLTAKSNDETFAFAEKLWAMRRVGEIIDQIDLHGQNQELVNELVGLATRHGILTPYTSFLADENTNVHDLAFNRRRAEVELRNLESAEGVSGFVQRDIKLRFQQLNQPSAPGVHDAGAEAAAGLSGARGTSSAAKLPQGGGSSPMLRSLQDDKPVAVNNVRQIGNKTFYFRNSQWFDSSITETQEKNIRKIERYSGEYFDLLKKLGRDAAKYAAADEPVVVVLEGMAYSF